MKVLYFWPLALLALVPVIIFMYLLKQKADKHAGSGHYIYVSVETEGGQTRSAVVISVERDLSEY